LASQHRSANLVSGCATPFPLRTDIIQRREESHEQTFVPLFLLKETEEAKEKEPRVEEKRAEPWGETGHKEQITEKKAEQQKKNTQREGENKRATHKETRIILEIVFVPADKGKTQKSVKINPASVFIIFLVPSSFQKLRENESNRWTQKQRKAEEGVEERR
jgi:hypothetical protein